MGARLALAALLMVASACTLSFDTGEVAFEEARVDVGADMGRDPGDENMDADVPDVPPDLPEDADAGPKPVEGLGELCGIQTPQCVPEDDLSWPDCAHRQCQGDLGEDALCLFATSPFGFCSRPCTADSQCVGDPRDPFTASMRCATDEEGNGYCVPGSQDPCDQDPTCPDGEVCKLARTVFPSGLNPGLVCQTATPGGVEAGSFCIDDPRRHREGVVRFCANDFCFDDVCAAFCDPEAEDACGNPNLICRTDYLDLVDFSTLRRSPPADAGLCLPATCESPAMCSGADALCTPGITERAVGEAEDGVCREDNPDSRGSGGLGDDCNQEGPDHAACGSRYCAGFPPNYYCSSLCDTDQDCGPGQLCAVDTIVDQNGGYFSRICRYAEGSKARCDRNGDPACPPREVCAPFIFGDVVQGGTKLSGAHAEGRCVAPVQGGIRSGNACGEEECIAPDACVRFPGAETAQCVTVCGNGSHCESPIDPCISSAIFISGENTVEGEDLVLGICAF